jgi:SWI/SNF-related matrix-associated actin-dependent regulator of chromatin subfamily A-like protein 1
MALPLFDYQETGAHHLARRARTGLFDDVGVGKSAQAIRALDLRAADRVIVVCKATARKNWRNEFSKFATRPRRLCIGETVHDFYAWQRGRFDTLITSYDQAAKWARAIRDSCEPLEAVVFDEGQELRNENTLRTTQLLGRDSTGREGLLQFAVCGWWLTGTPIWNDPSDIYTFLRACEVMPLDKKAFSDRYFKSRARTYSVTHRPRPEMLPELRALIANNSIRRTLEQTGVELPPLLASTFLVDGDTQPVRELLAQYPGLDQIIIDALQEGRSISALDTDHVATLRRLIGEAKSIPYAAMLLDELRNGLDKMVVFGIHRNALAFGNDYLLSHGIRSAIINGSTSSTQDDNNLRAFQTDPEMRVLWCNIQSSGTSLTMTAANHIDMLESAWTDQANYQAIRRVHRLTQTRGVRARFITLADSFDETVNEIVAGKAAACAMLDTARPTT